MELVLSFKGCLNTANRSPYCLHALFSEDASTTEVWQRMFAVLEVLLIDSSALLLLWASLAFTTFPAVPSLSFESQACKSKDHHLACNAPSGH